MTEKIFQLIEEKKFSELEDLWMELLEKDQFSLKDFLEVAEKLKAMKQTARGFMLLEILASHLEIQGRIEDAIVVYKHMPYFTEDDGKIRKALMNLYKKRYADNNRIEKYLMLSGIDKGEHIFKSIERLEEFLKFDIGQVFYFERYGLGKIISMNPEKKECVIDFEKLKGYFVKFDVAQGLLTPISQDHFLYKKYYHIEELKKLLLEDPHQLVKYLLKSFDAPLSSGQIKTHLEGIVESSELDRFWEKVRKKLEKDECIKAEMIKGQKVYQFLEGIDKGETFLHSFERADIDTKYELAERCVKDQPELSKQILSFLSSIGNEIYKTNPARALDILYLCQDNGNEAIDYTIDELFKYGSYEEIIRNLKNIDHQKRFLQIICKRHPDDWQPIFQRILFTLDNTKLLDEIESQLITAGFDLKETYRTIFLMPQKFSVLFQWLVKKLGQGTLSEFISPSYLPRLISSLDSIKGTKQIFLKAISLERFDELIMKASESEAITIKEALTKCLALKDFEKNDYLRIVDFHFPDLKSEKEDFVYTTAEALIKKKQELEHLLQVEIPKNKEEISRAREYGDLSENFEYKAAKERQDQLYQRVRMIEADLQKAKIIDFRNLDISRVCVGSKVILKNLQDNITLEYTILGPWDTDLSRNIISNESPLAKNLLDKKIGDRIDFEKKTYEILKIESPEIQR
ncbi:MAG: transcription elongation factor GreA [candidate division WOR-3 bacterium]